MRKIHWKPWHDPFDIPSHDDTMQVPCAVTPLGIMPMHEGSCPGSLFKVWVGHTNFTLTEAVAGQIAQEPGVEGADILSRYRFRVVIGEQFSDKAVLKGVETTVCKGQSGLSPIVSFLHTAPDNIQWGLVQMPNGKVCFYSSPEANDVERWLSLFSDVPKTTMVSWRAFCDD